jgi:hypothetical protein
LWIIEQANTTNSYYIKNVTDGVCLVYFNGTLAVSNMYQNNESVALWIIEQ